MNGTEKRGLSQTTCLIVWFLLLTIIVLYLGAFLLEKEKYGVAFAGVIYRTIAWVLAGSSVGFAIVSLLLRYFALRRPAVKGRFSLNSIAGSARLVVVSLINWFLVVVFVLCGVLLYLISAYNPWIFGAFLLGAVGLMVIHHPGRGLSTDLSKGGK
ncbi:MAG: hypothetical protein GY866_22530 [Proteobacteria bacterium]|nr:hypothetical protein [Pseudomonadota bacterium]